MFWQYVIKVCIFVGGFIYATLSCVNPMICVNFALPATKRLSDKGWLTDAASVRRIYRRPVTFWFFANLIVFGALFFFVPMKHSAPFFIGVLFCIITSIGKTFSNANNAQEYMSRVYPFFKATNENELEMVVSIITKGR